jgi:hypothetical protein
MTLNDNLKVFGPSRGAGTLDDYIYPHPRLEYHNRGLRGFKIVRVGWYHRCKYCSDIFESISKRAMYCKGTECQRFANRIRKQKQRKREKDGL